MLAEQQPHTIKWRRDVTLVSRGAGKFLKGKKDETLFPVFIERAYQKGDTEVCDITSESHKCKGVPYECFQFVETDPVEAWESATNDIEVARLRAVFLEDQRAN